MIIGYTRYIKATYTQVILYYDEKCSLILMGEHMAGT
jgi:hypothetical protein